MADLYIVNVDNLRLRETPGIDGKIIKDLSKGTALNFIEKGKKEIVNGVEGTWIKVETVDNVKGWCFDAYLIVEKHQVL